MQYNISINATVNSTLSLKELENKLAVCLFDIESEKLTTDGESNELEVIDYYFLEVSEDIEHS